MGFKPISQLRACILSFLASSEVSFFTDQVVSGRIVVKKNINTEYLHTLRTKNKKKANSLCFDLSCVQGTKLHISLNMRLCPVGCYFFLVVSISDVNHCMVGCPPRYSRSCTKRYTVSRESFCISTLPFFFSSDMIVDTKRIVCRCFQGSSSTERLRFILLYIFRSFWCTCTIIYFVISKKNNCHLSIVGRNLSFRSNKLLTRVILAGNVPCPPLSLPPLAHMNCE